MRLSCGVGEAAIAEAIAVRGQVESRVASLVAQVEATKLCAISEITG